MPECTDLEAFRLISGSEVSRLCGIPYPSLMKFVRDGQAPQPVKLGMKKLGWKLAEVRAYLEYGAEWRDHVETSEASHV